MRRLWSYIILGLTAIVMMGAGFANVFTKVNGNIEYKEGRELVFRISDRADAEITDDTAVKAIANTMIDRLEAQDVTQYRVSTQGLDTITVQLEQDTSANYDNIQTLLTFNGTLALTSKLDESILQDEFRTDDKVYYTSENNLPVIYIPVGKEINKIYEIVKTYKDENKTEAAEETAGEGEESESTYNYYIYLWHDYDPDFDTFAKTQSGDQYDEHVAKKIIMKFNVQDIQDQITVDGEEGKITYLKTYVNIDPGKNEQYEAREVKKAYETARFYVNLLNASALDFDVTFLYSNLIPAWTDELVDVSGNVLWSQTLIATVCAIAFFTLILIFFYRLCALSIITVTLGSIFGALGMIVLFAAEFNVATLVGFIIVSVVSMVSGVIYNTKFKEECYRGRSLKKANSEGAKKALLPTVDVHVVVIAVGIFSYLLGGTMMRGFAAVTVLGGLISLLLNIFALRGMMWLITNTTNLQGKYEVFGVDQDKVPDVIKEEKQQYFGKYADKDFTRKAKPVGIIACLALIAGVIGLSVMGNVNKGGSVYNNGSTTLPTQIYVETDTKNTSIKLPAVENVLDNTFVFKGQDESNAKALSSYVAVDADKEMKIQYKTRTDTDAETKEEITYTYYIIDLKGSEVFGNDYNAYYLYTLPDSSTVKRYATEGVQALLAQFFEEAYSDTPTVSIKGNEIVSTYRPSFLSVFWGTLVGTIIAGVYLLLRYRLSRGIVALLAPVAVSSAIAGVVALTHLPVTSAAAFAVPFVAIFTSILTILFMNKERELVIEDKAHDKSIENRKSIMERATSLAAYPMVVSTFLAAYLVLDFFGFGPAKNAWMFLIFILGAAISLCLTLVLFGPISQFFYRLFSKVDTEKVTSRFHRKKKVKKNQSPRNKSAEPEEYTFIGIND